MFEDAVQYLAWMLPWEFSPAILLFFTLTAALYIRGLCVLARESRSISGIRVFSFLSGLILCYIVMHTGYDYYAQYMFFMHRIQHLILHHLGPFLMALSVPFTVLKKGLPSFFNRPIQAIARMKLFRAAYRFLQFPPWAAFLFVGLIYFWLSPDIHFAAMLNQSLYQLMNWSMFLDGLLFWWLILNPNVSDGITSLRYGWRILLLLLIMVPQIVLGASIVFSKEMIFDVYEVCGRAWPLDPMTDQIAGGIVTWIPPAMMSVIGILIMLRYLSREHRDGRKLDLDDNYLEIQRKQMPVIQKTLGQS